MLESGAPAPYAFTGREWDAESGLYYYRARYYDPKIGRFMSEDPVGFAGGSNFYVYVGNRAPNFTDPYGLCAVSPEAQECLRRLLNEDVSKVKFEYKPNPRSKFTATTRKNKIIVYDCDEFLKPHILLEEYYHVFRQWNRKRLFGVRYVADSVYRFLAPGQDRYWDNKYEKEAQGWAAENADEFEKCLGCPE